MGFWNKADEDKIHIPQKTLQIHLAKRPVEGITHETFVHRHVSIPNVTTLSPDTAIVRVLYLSCDPAMRLWLSPSRSYMPAVKEGTVMYCAGVGQVVHAAGQFSVGDVVWGLLGWTQYSVVPVKQLTRVKIPRGMPVSASLGVLGITGMTAYFGMIEVGKVKKGDCVVVSAAAGATGSIAVQIAKNVYGCKTIGIAGGPVKCRYLEKELGVTAVDYKSEEGVEEGLKRALNGRRIDVYFDNVGGSTLEAALRRINVGARIVVCGAISGYNKKVLQPGPYNYVNLIACHASMAGFLLNHYEKQFESALNQLERWIGSGNIEHREEVVVGLENAPVALQRLFEGKNIGKVVVKVADSMTAGRRIAAKL